MVKVLEKAGCTVVYNTQQTCCGQPAFNAGFREESREVCIKFLEDFSGTDFIVSPSASCTGFVRNYYPTLFPDSALLKEVKQTGKRIYEFSEFLVNVLKIDDFQSVLWGKATYHDSCAALRECKIRKEPRRLLSKVKGLELMEMKDVETCCGFGGTFAVKYPEISNAMAADKAANIRRSGANTVVTCDAGCLMQTAGFLSRQGSEVRCLHLAELLASRGRS